MGYRTYLGTVDKTGHDQMQKMSLFYLKEKYGDGETVGVYELVEELIGFGKYFDVDTTKYPHFFASEEMQKEFSDYDFWIVDRDFLRAIISKEHLAMAEWFEECSGKTHEELIRQMKMMATEWRGDFGVCPYNLDLTKPHLVDSWKRDYAIFDLVRIYKTFDFEKNNLIYYGW